MRRPCLRLRYAVFASALLAVAPAFGQVKCKMPNGLVIEQKLSQTCPNGAVDINKPIASTAPTRIAFHDGKGRVTAKQFGAAWPLTIESGTLVCTTETNKTQAVTLIAGSETYAINGTANSKAAKMGWRNVRWIWAPNPDIPGTNKPISPLIEAGLKLCQ